MTNSIYLNLIKKLHKKKYRNFIFSTEQEKIYLKYRKRFYDEIESFLEKHSENLQNINYTQLSNFLIKIKKKNKPSKKDKFFIYNLRKKFEVNLNLKNNYDKNLIKLTNQNAGVDSLVLLVECIYKFKLLNKISTLNLILKVVDKINLEFYQKKLLTQFPKSIIRVITYEKKLYKFFNNSI